MTNKNVKSFQEWQLNEDDEFNLDTPAEAPLEEPKEEVKKDITTINYEQLYCFDYFLDNKALVIVTDCPPTNIENVYESFLSLVEGGYEDNFDDFLRDKGFVAIAATKSGMIKSK